MSLSKDFVGSPIGRACLSMCRAKNNGSKSLFLKSKFSFCYKSPPCRSICCIYNETDDLLSYFSHQKRFAHHNIHAFFPYVKNAKLPMVIENKFIPSSCKLTAEYQNHSLLIRCPATQDLLGMSPQCSDEEIDIAVKSAKKSFEMWRNQPLFKRIKILRKFYQIIESHSEKLATIITKEQGKTLEDARAEIVRGLEVLDYTSSGGISSFFRGKNMMNIATNINTMSTIEPLGVCAGIAPFNFPFMIPLWMYPVAIACGNTFVMKPSERVPLTTMKTIEYLIEAGLPPGVVNIVHGGIPTVEALCNHPDIAAVSFVGSNNAGETIHKLAKTNGKRVLCNMGAKNHAIVLPDANKENTIDAICGAAFGAAGQRCMAISVVLLVGEAQNWLHEILKRAKLLKVGCGFDDGVDIGPLISDSSRNRIVTIINESEREGGEIVLDGRDVQIQNYPKGNFISPTIIRVNNVHNTAYKEEIFGPVLCVMNVSTFDEAIKIVNSNPYGNGTTLYTNDSHSINKYIQEVNITQVGINIPIPVPVPPFSFTSTKRSILGEHYFYGENGFSFFTQEKTIVSRFFDRCAMSSNFQQKVNTVFPTDS